MKRLKYICAFAVVWVIAPPVSSKGGWPEHDAATLFSWIILMGLGVLMVNAKGSKK